METGVGGGKGGDLGELLLPAFWPPRLRRQALIFPSRATGLGLVTLAWACGNMMSLTLMTWSPPFITNYIGYFSTILSLSLFSMLPETQNLPHIDILEHFSIYKR